MLAAHILAIHNREIQDDDPPAKQSEQNRQNPAKYFVCVHGTIGLTGNATQKYVAGQLPRRFRPRDAVPLIQTARSLYFDAYSRASQSDPVTVLLWAQTNGRQPIWRSIRRIV